MVGKTKEEKINDLKNKYTKFDEKKNLYLVVGNQRFTIEFHSAGEEEKLEYVLFFQIMLAKALYNLIMVEAEG